MSSARTRKDILIALVQNAEKFPNVHPDGTVTPLCWMQAIILSKLAADWVETDDVPSDEDWDRHAAKEEVKAAMEEAEHEPKH